MRKPTMKKCAIAFFVLFSALCLTTHIANAQITNDVSGLTFDKTTGTLVMDTGSYSVEDLYSAIEDPSIELKHVEIVGDITIDNDTVKTGFFSFCARLETVETEGTVQFIGEPSWEGTFEEGSLFNMCLSLKEVDLSKWNFESPITSMFNGCQSLETVVFPNMALKDTDGVFANPVFDGDFSSGEATKFLGYAYLPNLSSVTFSSETDFGPVTGESDEENLYPFGSYFNYEIENGWNAFQNNELVASNISSYDEMRAYQTTHPGLTTFVWAEDGPSPEGSWVEDDHGWRFMDHEGNYVTGWQWIESSEGVGHWFYFGDDTYCVKNQWMWFEEKGWMYLGDRYYALQNEWLFDNASWYYFGGDCLMLTNSWLWDTTFGAHWYYFWSNGVMAENAWLWDGAWYYVHAWGAMAVGTWEWIDNAWYGFWWNGVMCKGWVWDAGYSAWYYCYDNGVMAKNATVDGYKLNASGAWK